MKWKHVVEVSKDVMGSSESWDIKVAVVSDGVFAWQTSGSEPDDEVDSDEAIDTGSADYIAEYLVENASGFEAELIDGLSRITLKAPRFTPLLNAVKKQIGHN